MEKMTLEKLNQIKEQQRRGLRIRREEGESKIIVHMGTCGIASGAPEVMNALLEEMSRDDVPEVTIAQSSCIGLCDREPIVTVIRAGESPVKYYHMDNEKMRKVFREHLIKGKVVEELTH